MSVRLLVLVLATTAACKGEASSAAPEPRAEPEAAPAPVEAKPIQPTPSLATADEDAYREDISRLCNVLALSGAETLDEGSRMYTVASWLGSNLVTETARDFLVAIQRENDGAKKGDILRAEAEGLDLPPCKLADSWH